MERELPFGGFNMLLMSDLMQIEPVHGSCNRQISQMNFICGAYFKAICVTELGWATDWR
jgi:hypothetical protein